LGKIVVEEIYDRRTGRCVYRGEYLPGAWEVEDGPKAKVTSYDNRTGKVVDQSMHALKDKKWVVNIVR